MDTSFIDCDVQPTYIRVTIKGKVSMCTHHQIMMELTSLYKEHFLKINCTGYLYWVLVYAYALCYAYNRFH